MAGALSGRPRRREIGSPEVAGQQTLGALLEAQARTVPGAAFIIFDDLRGQVTTRTYREFDREVNRVAHLLCRLGVGRGDTITLLLANCLEFLALWFGAAKLGTVIVPVNTASSASELEFLVGHSESRLIFTDASRLDLARQVRDRCSGVEEVLVCGDGAPSSEVDFGLRVAACPDIPPEGPALLPTDEAAILYTSGTTARPKGVLVTHANYICAGETVARAVRLTPDDRHLVVLPLFHGNAQYYSTMSALVTGASVALMARFSASRYFDQAIAHRCSVSSLFAAPIRMLLAQPRRPEHARNGLRAVIFAQSVTPAQLSEWHERFRAPLLQLWGMTETMGPPIINPLDGERRNMSMGLPVPGYASRLVDEDGRSVARGDIGQIVVRGEPGRSLMKGYHKNPEATAETLRDGWLWSGDNARQDEDGYYHFVDRAKDMIKRSGENVAASEVEAVIREHPGVFDCAVIGVPDALRDEAIVAVVVPRAAEGDVPAVGLSEDEVLIWCRERLASFRVPQFVRFRAELPRTAVGKIRKHVLRAEFHSRTGAGGSVSGPPKAGFQRASGTQPRSTRMTTTTQDAVRQTYKDYCATPDDERYELLNGNLMMVPAPNRKHQWVLGRLHVELDRFTREHGLGEVYVAPFDVVLSDTDVVQPDLLFISRAREHTLTDANVRGAPDLVIEILSPSTADRDLGYKRDLYGRHGVLEYWIVDPIGDTVAVHRQRDGRLELAETFGRRDPLRTELLAGLQLQLDDIFGS